MQNTQAFLSSSEETLPYYLYDLIKTFLYSVYSQRLKYDDFEVIRMMGKAEPTVLKTQQVSITEDRETGHFRISDTFVEATVNFKDELYDLSTTRELTRDRWEYRIYSSGLSANSSDTEQLIQFLKREGIQTSSYCGKCLEVNVRINNWSEDNIYVEKAEMEADRLEDIFLPPNVRDNISLFIQALTNYSTIRKPLRYLFAGRPGTAKTKIIRAIAKECQGKATFLFTNGNERRIKSLFDFVELFSPIVLCVDDIDLMTGSRKEGLYTEHLANFLQKLDGFVHKDFFLLATTNDKRLVDLAASRPGRFDLIIDINLIQPEQYFSLVSSKTQRSEIIGLFDEETLNNLKLKKVTGAFISNIIKHLELIAEFEPDKLEKDYVLRMINESYRGFYKELEASDIDLGFRN